MRESWLHKPVVFFGKRLYLFFAAVASIPVWLAANEFMSGMPLKEEEASATAVTMCFFAGVFTGRYIMQVWSWHSQVQLRRRIIALALFNFTCLVLLFVHADTRLTDMPRVNLLLFWLPFLLISLATGIIIKAVRLLAERQLKEARTSAAQSESELKLLQSQLSPHFLFNTLNNMYGLSITEHEKIPTLLLRLSDLLRYSVYGSNEVLVPLKNELDYINNYIEFEKIRLGDRLQLQTHIEPVDDKQKIAPMLLIVFVENAFKHSKNTIDEQVFIDISLKTWGDMILFSVENSHSRAEKRFDKNSGFGLDNVRKRLELLYLGAYTLDIKEDDHSYAVMLQLKNEHQK